MSGNSQQNTTDGTSGTKRRAFLIQTGVGLTAGLAGCTGGDSTPTATEEPAGDEDTATPMETASPTPTMTEGMSFDDVTLEFVTWPQFVNNQEKVNGWLHDAGMPEGISVKFSNVFNVSEGARAKYQQWLSAGREKPDLMELGVGFTQPFIARKQLLPLEEVMDDEVLSEIKNDYFPQNVRANSDGDGNLWTFPHFTEPPEIQYRKDLAEEAGYDPDGNDWATSPMTWKRFSEVVADIRDQTDASTGYLFQASPGLQLGGLVFNEWLSSFGGAYFGNPEENLWGPPGQRPVTVAEQPVVDSVRMGKTLIKGSDADDTLDGYKQISPESVYQGQVFGQMQAFGEGGIVAMRNWPFTAGFIGGEDGLGQDLGWMPMPYGVEDGEGKYPGTGGSRPSLGGWNIGINPNSKNPQAAAEVIKAMHSDEMMINTFELAGWTPPKRSLLDSDAARNVETWGRFVDTLLYSLDRAMPRPETAVWVLERKRCQERVHEALRDTPAADAMSTLKGELKEIEESY